MLSNRSLREKSLISSILLRELHSIFCSMSKKTKEHRGLSEYSQGNSKGEKYSKFKNKVISNKQP